MVRVGVLFFFFSFKKDYQQIPEKNLDSIKLP